MTELSRPEDRIPPKTLVAPCRDLPAGAAFGWLREGWGDLMKSKRVSLVYGLFVFVVSVLVATLAWRLGGYVLLFSALSGFVFVAPLLAFGLYSVSRQLCEGREPTLRSTLHAMRSPLGNSMVFTLVLLVVFLLWVRAGMMVQVFFPLGGDPEWGKILTFLAIGSAVGSIFACVSFAAAAFSLPMRKAICESAIARFEVSCASWSSARAISNRARATSPTSESPAVERSCA